jgi:NAD(P)H-flavin reductase
MEPVHDVPIVEASPAAVGHAHVLLERPEGFAEKPGQYAMAQLPGDEKPRPLAFASRARSPLIELLIRTPDDARDALLAKIQGGRVKLSDPGGPGWRTEDAGDRPVWGVCVGSGISALRPLVDELSESAPARAGLLYGVRDDDHVCFADDLAAWRARGVRVEIAVSRPPDGDGARVQDRLDLIPDDAICLFVGMKDMVDSAKDALRARGFKDDDLRMNF